MITEEQMSSFVGNEFDMVLIAVCQWTIISFFLSPTNSNEIENLVMSLSSTKACGPFSISTSLLKTLKSVLSVPLQLLFNCSFSTGMVPDQFKVARVVPIHKKGSSCLVSNYRPISLLSIFNKLIEKIMYNRIISYLEKFSILYNNQFGLDQSIQPFMLFSS